MISASLAAIVLISAPSLYENASLGANAPAVTNTSTADPAAPAPNPFDRFDDTSPSHPAAIGDGPWLDYRPAGPRGPSASPAAAPPRVDLDQLTDEELKAAYLLSIARQPVGNVAGEGSAKSGADIFSDPPLASTPMNIPAPPPTAERQSGAGFLWLIAIVLGGLLCLAVAVVLLFGAVCAWQLALILVVLGGFMGGGTGALVGAAIAGTVGVLAVWLMSR
jgi:hypothetical protein